MRMAIMAAGCMLCGTSAGEEILWWLVNDSATVDNEVITTFFADYPEDDDNWNAARVKVTASNGDVHYLTIEYPGMPGERFDTAWFGEILDEHGNVVEWGTGNWSTQSPLDGMEREMYEEARFQVELGRCTYDQVLDFVTFSKIAESDEYAKSELTQFLYERGALDPPGLSQWTPLSYHTFTPVPEPDAGLLALLGICLLGLRRRNMKGR